MKVSLQLHFAALRDKDFTSLIYNLWPVLQTSS